MTTISSSYVHHRIPPFPGFYARPMPDLDTRTVGGGWNRSIQDGLPWAQETCGERSSLLTIPIALSRRTFPSGSFVSLTLS